MSVLQMPEAGGLPEIVRRRVRGLLAEREMTQQQLAARLGISPTSMSQRLKGRMEFALSELPELAAVLGTSELYLLGFTDDRTPGRTAGGSGSVRHVGLEPTTR